MPVTQINGHFHPPAITYKLKCPIKNVTNTIEQFIEKQKIEEFNFVLVSLCISIKSFCVHNWCMYNNKFNSKIILNVFLLPFSSAEVGGAMVIGLVVILSLDVRLLLIHDLFLFARQQQQLKRHSFVRGHEHEFPILFLLYFYMFFFFLLTTVKYNRL